MRSSLEIDIKTICFGVSSRREIFKENNDFIKEAISNDEN